VRSYLFLPILRYPTSFTVRSLASFVFCRLIMNVAQTLIYYSFIFCTAYISGLKASATCHRTLQEIIKSTQTKALLQDYVFTVLQYYSTSMQYCVNYTGGKKEQKGYCKKINRPTHFGPFRFNPNVILFLC